MSDFYNSRGKRKLSLYKPAVKALLIFQLLLICQHVSAQKFPGVRIPLPGEEKELLNQLGKTNPGIPQAEILLNLAACYLFIPGEEKDDLSKALNYVRKAKAQSIQLNFIDGVIEALQLEGNILIENEQTEISKPLLDSALLFMSERKLKNGIVNEPERELRALLQLGKIYLLLGDLELSQKYFLDALKFSKANNFSVLHYIFQHLSIVEMWKGDWNRSLFYELEALRSMESSGDFSSAGNFYNTLGFIYRQVGQVQKAIEYFEMAYDFYKKKPSSIIFQLCASISEAMTKLERPMEGITQLRNKIQFYPPVTDFEKREIEISLATCYRVLKNYDSAEVHYLRLLNIQRKDRLRDIADINKMLGQLYVEWGKYNMAKPFLDISLSSEQFSGRSLSHLYFLLFKADSAAGNHLAAIDYLMKNKKIDETLYREAKTRENQELLIKYESEKKDKDLKIKEQNILLLTRMSELQRKNNQQAELKFRFDSISKDQDIKLLNAEFAKKDRDLLLKQQNIDLMKKQGQLNEVKLYQTTSMKNVTFAGVILLFIILALLYSRYRLKQKVNKEISEKNKALQHLVDEKEWLLKEVHHRVKNNLHTVMSLLETQSAYLKDDALAAVRNSQHRVFAMSLIHQKLYQLENSTNINLAVYLPELIEYLRDSFDVQQRIRFRTEVENIQLDISKAIPIGLIVNEAVTNSIKYAFPGNVYGDIQIEIKRSANNLISLSIKDNGIGLPHHWEIIQKNSLGLKLMKGLSEDIQGTFSIEQSSGTKIKVKFFGDLVEKESKKNEHAGILL